MEKYLNLGQFWSILETKTRIYFSYISSKKVRVFDKYLFGQEKNNSFFLEN